MTDTTTTVLNSLYVQVYDKEGVEKTYPDDNALWTWFEETVVTKNINAKGVQITHLTAPNPSFGTIPEGGNYVAPGAPTFTPGIVKHARPNMQTVFTGDAFDMQDTETVANTFVETLDADRAAFRSRINQQIEAQSGTGQIGIVATRNVGALTFTSVATDPTNPCLTGSRNIPIGAQIQFFTSGGTQHQGGSVPVSTVQTNDQLGGLSGSGTVTCDALPSDLAVGDIVVFAGSYGISLTGLPGIVTDQNVTMQGVNLANFPTLKAAVVDAQGNGLSESILDTAIRRTRYRTGVNMSVNDFVMVMHPKQVDAYRRLGYSLNRIVNASNNAKLDLAFPYVSHRGIPFKEDLDCPDSYIWGLRLKSWRIYSIKKKLDKQMGLSDKGSGSYFREVPSGTAGAFADRWIGTRLARVNIGCVRPQEQFLVKNLSIVGFD